MFCAVCARSDHSAAHLSRSSARWLTLARATDARSRGCSPSGAYASPPPSRRSTRRFSLTSRFRVPRDSSRKRARRRRGAPRSGRKSASTSIFTSSVLVLRVVSIVVSRSSSRDASSLPRFDARANERSRRGSAGEGSSSTDVGTVMALAGHPRSGDARLLEFDRTVGRRCFSIGPESARRAFNTGRCAGRFSEHLCALRWTTRARWALVLSSQPPGSLTRLHDRAVGCAEKSDPRQK